MLKYKFLFPLLILVAVAIFSVGLLTFFRTSRELQDTALVDMQRSAFLLRNATETWIDNRHSELKELAQNDTFRQSAGAALATDSFLAKANRQVATIRLTEIVANSPFYNRLLLVNREGIILAASGYTGTESLSDEYAQFLSSSLAEMQVKSPGRVLDATGLYNGKFHYLEGVSLVDEDKGTHALTPLDGIIIADVNVQELIDSIFSKISFGHSGYASLYDKSGLEIGKAHTDNLLVLSKMGSVTEHPASDVYFIRHGNSESVLVTKALDRIPWILGVTVNKSEFTEPAYHIAYEIAVIGLIVTCFTALLIMLFLHWILQPIQSLAATAKAVTLQRDYSLRAKKYSNDELGLLVVSFNNMLKQIEFRDHELEQVAHKLEKSRDEAEEARKKAEIASRAKSEFLANMSHELRTPLNSIVGLTDLLIEEKMEAEHLEMVGLVKRSSINLLEVVNDILDLSKIENTGMILEAVPFDFRKAVQDIVEVLAPLASQKGISLDIIFSQKIPYLIGDEARVKRILMNLVSNAIKYTPKGSVEVIVEQKKLPDDRIEVTIHVKDTGIGISEDKFDKIFEKFTQADESTTRKFGGTGLGLTIAKKLTEMMDGRISLTSKLDVGSVFTFSIAFKTADRLEEEKDVKAAAATPAPVIRKPAELIPHDRIRVLIAEDNELNQIFIKKLFATLGMQTPVLAGDGQDALDKWDAGNYDLILMDCHMPKINGYDATRLIREEEDKMGRHTPIIAMTADVMAGTKEKCLKSGMDDYISKPVDKQKFVSLLGNWISFPDKVKAAPGNKGSNEAPPVDLTYVKEVGGGDIAVEREFVTVFLEQADTSFATLKENRTDGKNQVWSETMHYLKGSFGLMGAESLRSLCEKGQHMLEATAAERAALFDEITAAYGKARVFLEKAYPAGGVSKADGA